MFLQNKVNRERILEVILVNLVVGIKQKKLETIVGGF